MERITLDAAWELTVMNFLNDLSYLKSKQIYDKQLLDELKNAHF